MPEKNKAPVKNIGLYMVDVKRPKFSYTEGGRRVRLNLGGYARVAFSGKKIRHYPPIRFAAAFLGVGILLAIIVGFFNLGKARVFLAEKSSKILDNFALSFEAFREFDFGKAENKLAANKEEISFFGGIFGAGDRSFSLRSITDSIPILKDAGATLRGMASLNLSLMKFAGVLDDLKNNGFSYFQSDGEAFLDKFRLLQSLLGKIVFETQSVRNAVASLQAVSPGFAKFDEVIGREYVSYLAEMRSLNDFLGSLEKVLASAEDKNIALLFNNPSEIRPGGGFLGSYGVLSVRNGQMSNLEVGDIYWPDHPTNLIAKFIPPEPLQFITKDWGARDANWFFDFPTSAETIISFLEKSKIYKEKNIKFDGAIAINVSVLQSIIQILGPVKLIEYELEIDEKNFLIELQREVEAGRDKKPGQNPKRILSVLTPILLEKISSLPNDGKSLLFEAIRKHVQKKDIMFFSRDKEIASFLRNENLDGGVYDLPSSFWGTYLAVVNANIAGGKSDAFIKEKIDARIDVDSEGGASVNVAVTRTHDGQGQKDPWWRATNKNFIQIFTNAGSFLGFLKGNDPTAKILTTDYSGSGYEKLFALERVESTKRSLPDYNAWSYDAFGKRVYAAWFSLPAGKSKILELRYENPPPPREISIASGKKYQVIFDRQSGVQTSLRISLNAPIGYRWVESQSPVYIFESQDPDRRIVINLNLTHQPY